MSINTFLTEAFIIPDDLVGSVPCQYNAGLYTDSALDADLDDPDFLALDRDTQISRLSLKQAAETTAVAACQTCPLLSECAAWSLNTEVFGVAGGMTDRERKEFAAGSDPDRTVDDLRVRGKRQQIREDVVYRWFDIGMDDDEIAGFIKAHRRTIQRYRVKYTNLGGRARARTEVAPTVVPETTTDLLNAAGVVTPAVPPVDRLAKEPLNFARLSPESLAILDVLRDGGIRDRNHVMNAVAHLVSDTAALSASKHLPGPVADRLPRGRGRFLANRLDMLRRRGRLLQTTMNSTTMVWLPEDVRAEYHAWRLENYETLPESAAQYEARLRKTQDAADAASLARRTHPRVA